MDKSEIIIAEMSDTLDSLQRNLDFAIESEEISSDTVAAMQFSIDVMRETVKDCEILIQE